MADQIWTGAKWSIAAWTTALNDFTVTAIKNQLGGWARNGYISFTDNPALNNYNEFGEFFGTMTSLWLGYLFSKTFFPNKIFPSLIMTSVVEAVIEPPFYHYMVDNFKVIFNWHAKNLSTSWVDYAVSFYITLISAWTAELSKFPLI